jgi:hypothetical protein
VTGDTEARCAWRSLETSTPELSASATHLHHLGTTGSCHLLLLSLRNSEIVEFLSLALGEISSLLNFLLNCIDLLGHLTSLQLSLRGLFAFGKERNILL